jgi:hypothetical protein
MSIKQKDREQRGQAANPLPLYQQKQAESCD